MLLGWALAVLSPALGYSNIYAYHVWLVFASPLILVWLNENAHAIIKSPVRTLLLFTAWAALTVLYVANYKAYFAALSYLMVSMSACVIGFAAAVSTKNGDRSLKMAVISIGLVLIFSGVLEAFGIIRLPFSPYSPYASLFGRSVDTTILDASVLSYNTSKPTGFSGNPNTYGFVLLLIAPFLFVHDRAIIRSGSVAMVAIVIFAIDSRALALGFFALLLAYFVLFAHSWERLLSLTLMIVVATAVLGSGGSPLPELRRIGDAPGDVLRLLQERGSQEGDSVQFRSYLYRFGISEFLSSRGLGIGLGGVEGRLSEVFGAKVAFHNFFLQVLVDLGVVGLLVFLRYYVIVLRSLRSVIRRRGSSELWMLKGGALSLLVTPITSIAPSGLAYNLPYWAMLGMVGGLAYQSHSDHAARDRR